MEHIDFTVNGWRIDRPNYASRRAGNRDTYLHHESGARAQVWPTFYGTFMAGIPGHETGPFPTRREALTWVMRWAIPAYHGEPVEMPDDPSSPAEAPCSASAVKRPPDTGKEPVASERGSGGEKHRLQDTNPAETRLALYAKHGREGPE